MFLSRRRILAEDALKHLLDREQAGTGVTAPDMAAALALRPRRATAALARLRNEGLARAEDGAFHLTQAGRQQALALLRRHRLYETWLAHHSGLPPEDWHRLADRAEHRIDPQAADRLADRLGNPRFDPHGDPIPTREGTMPPRARVCLNAWQAGADAVIDHIEDEPPELFRQIGAQDVHPGMVIQGLRHLDDGSVSFHAEGRCLTLAAHLAAMVQVTALPAGVTADSSVRRLSELAPGEEAHIDCLSPACTGAERHRLLDLGLVPGTAIRCEFTSPFDSPRAYFLRGTLVALRREQAERILIKPALFP